MKCTELITQDHVILRRGLDILDRMVNKMEEGERIEIADITTILKFFRLFGDEYHQTMEEKVLLPSLMRAAPEEGALHQMLLEHGEERALVAAIETALNSNKGMAFVLSSRRLMLLLRNHLDKEDAVLCDIAERFLSKEEDEAAVAEFAKNQTQSETYAGFARLERKYTPKPHGTPIERGRRAHA